MKKSIVILFLICFKSVSAIAQIVEKSEDLKKHIDVVNTGGGEGFTDIDLMSDEGYKKYENICQKFIITRSSNLLGITGEMMAKAAKTTYSTYQKYVPNDIIEAFKKQFGVTPKKLSSNS